METPESWPTLMEVLKSSQDVRFTNLLLFYKTSVQLARVSQENTGRDVITRQGQWKALVCVQTKQRQTTNKTQVNWELGEHLTRIGQAWRVVF